MPPRLAKLLAVVAAAVMIGGALWFRSRGDDDGDSSGTAGGRRFRVVCVTELEEVCNRLGREGLDVQVEEAGTTADALAEGGVPGYDAWITIAPWPEMVDVVRRGDQQDDVFAAVTPIASSDLVLLIAATDLGDDCGWDCVVDESDPQRKIGVPSEDSGLGPQVIANAFSSHHGNTDFSRDDFRGGEGGAWLAKLVAAPASSDAERRMATQGAAAYLAAGTTEQAAQPAIDSPAGRQKKLRLGAPEVTARADVVVATVTGRPATKQLVARLTGKNAQEVFTGAGWTAPAAEGPTGLPAADLLVALREEVDR